MPIMVPSKNALNTNPYRFSPCRSRATTGITVTTARASAATNVIVSTRPPVSARRCADHNPSDMFPLLARPYQLVPESQHKN